MDGFLHLKPTVGCQISTLIFDFFLWMVSTLIFEFCSVEGGLYKYSMKNILKTVKFLTTWGLCQRYCPGL